MEENNPVVNLSQSIMDLSQAMDGVKNSLKECRASGLTDVQIRDAIAESMPEEERPAFLAQWPMLSMMLAAL